MDTPIKLLLEKCQYNTDEPFDQKLLNLDFNNEILFRIRETDNVFATFNFDDNISLYLEPYGEGEEIKIKNGERFRFSSGRDEFGCYFPGLFEIKCVSGEDTDTHLFAVDPTNVSFESVLHIRKYVNNFYSGLSSDLLKKKKSGESYSESKNLPNASENINYMISNMPQLINYINQYVESKHVVARKIETISATSQKMGNKSIQWLAKKGMTKNNNLQAPEKVLVNKATFDVNNPQNQVFKRELLFWNSELNKAIHLYDSYLRRIDNVIDKHNSDINEDELSLDQKQADRKVSKTVIDDLKFKIQRTKKDLENANVIKEDYNNSLTYLRKYKTNLEYILYNSWVKQVALDRYIKDSVTDSRLRMMLQIKNEYLGVKNKQYNKGKKILGYAEKCTPKLFETYIYIILISILTEQGFEFIDFDIENDDLLFMLSNPGTMMLKMNDITCKIYYDNELRKSNDHFDGNEYVTISSRHNRPDFIISFLDEKDHLKDTLIVETKWRPLSNIYNENGDTDVVIQLKDYYNLAYHDHFASKKTKRGVVSKVIALYPDLSETMTQIQEEDIVAIGVLPCENIIDTNGFANLKQEVDAAIEAALT